MGNDSKIIFALDYNDLDDACRVAESLAPHVGLFKVGLELFAIWGPRAVVLISDFGDVFLDLKLHDIPETVKRAVQLTKYSPRVKFLSVHASGGGHMMAQAQANTDAKVLAVTMLTSMDMNSAHAVGYDTDDYQIEEIVIRQAQAALSSGVSGIICSPLEVRTLRSILDDQVEGTGAEKAVLVTPGVRPAGAEAHDQARFATPKAAVQGGANYVVVGRPIRDAKNPVEAARAINDEIAAAL